MAVRHYSVPHFFRQEPNTLLKRYFASHGLFGDVDFEKMRETKPDALLKAWVTLSDARRTAIEPQLREIFDLASGKGFHAIRDEAQWQLGKSPAEFATFFERLAAMAQSGFPCWNGGCGRITPRRYHEWPLWAGT
jgi:hypothetical protein